jgi:hypothetical protein
VAVYENNQVYRSKGGRKIYSVLATLAVKAIVTTIIGVPLAL